MTDDELSRHLRDVIAASVWQTPPVEQEPKIHLLSWKVFEFAGEDRFLGYHPAGLEGRLSTAIQSFSPELLEGETLSGRTYILEGPSGSHPDADWVLDRWLHAHGASRADVRFVPLSELQDRAQASEGG